MNYKLIVQPEAEFDISDAFNWYENNRPGLGYDFLLQIDAGFHFIIRNPDAHSVAYKGTRKHLIKRFPYKIIYILGGENIVILGVLHYRQSLDLINPRLMEFDA
jgi:plasmid stabilization system protein ParE